MLEMVELFNAEQSARQKVQIKIGVGIASGRVIAGFTGTQTRATYTCVGDTVNLAARLEAQTKLLGHPILIDENTRQGLDGIIRSDELEPVQLKGKLHAVRVFAVPTGQLS
jgi:class 3 adenylate cyclase